MTLARFTLDNPVQGHNAYSKGWLLAKALLVAEHRIDVLFLDHEDSLTDKQRNYYHGYVLKVIAQQVKVEGTRRYAMPVWKEWYRKEFLGYKTKTVTNPITGKKRRIRIRISTEGLGVRGYNILIEKVTASACTEFGVTFPVAISEWVDTDTGEIMGALQ